MLRALLMLTRAGAHALGDVEGLGDVGGVDRAAEAVGRVVGDAHRLVDVVERQDRQHRAEDLLAGDAHVVAHVGEDRRLQEVAARQVRRAAAAGGETRALGVPDGDVLLDLLRGAPRGSPGRA